MSGYKSMTQWFFGRGSLWGLLCESPWLLPEAKRREEVIGIVGGCECRGNDEGVRLRQQLLYCRLKNVMETLIFIMNDKAVTVLRRMWQYVPAVHAFGVKQDTGAGNRGFLRKSKLKAVECFFSFSFLIGKVQNRQTADWWFQQYSLRIRTYRRQWRDKIGMENEDKRN
jgi:hypothetical protein